MQKAVFNWSGGKDSALALYKVIQNKQIEIHYLLTTVSESNKRISMHGVCEELLVAQAKLIGIPLLKVGLPEKADMPVYDERISLALSELAANGIKMGVFGDIFLEDLRHYREEQLAKKSFVAEFPLWKINTLRLAHEFIDLGFKSILVCVDERVLDKSFVGRLFDKQLLQDLPVHVDPCGENGEFHTFVFEGPIFSDTIHFRKGEIVYKKYESDNAPHFTTGFWYCDLLPA